MSIPTPDPSDCHPLNHPHLLISLLRKKKKKSGLVACVCVHGVYGANEAWLRSNRHLLNYISQRCCHLSQNGKEEEDVSLSATTDWPLPKAIYLTHWNNYSPQIPPVAVTSIFIQRKIPARHLGSALPV